MENSALLWPIYRISQLLKKQLYLLFLLAAESLGTEPAGIVRVGLRVGISSSYAIVIAYMGLPVQRLQ